ncbi:MAG: hypothetical protein NVSMB53_12770 [Gemmatimonadaceae bacterium]
MNTRRGADPVPSLTVDLVRRLAVTTSQLLREYVAVHEDVLAPSRLQRLRRVLPIPGVFERIPFAAHTVRLTHVRMRLAELLIEAGQALRDPATHAVAKSFLTEYPAYVESLINAISKLSEICGYLSEHALGHGTTGFTQYQRDLEEYERLRSTYARLGVALNDTYTVATRRR